MNLARGDVITLSLPGFTKSAIGAVAEAPASAPASLFQQVRWDASLGALVFTAASEILPGANVTVVASTAVGVQAPFSGSLPNSANFMLGATAVGGNVFATPLTASDRIQSVVGSSQIAYGRSDGLAPTSIDFTFTAGLDIGGGAVLELVLAGATNAATSASFTVSAFTITSRRAQASPAGTEALTSTIHKAMFRRHFYFYLPTSPFFATLRAPLTEHLSRAGTQVATNAFTSGTWASSDGMLRLTCSGLITAGTTVLVQIPQTAGVTLPILGLASGSKTVTARLQSTATAGMLAAPVEVSQPVTPMLSALSLSFPDGTKTGAAAGFTLSLTSNRPGGFAVDDTVTLSLPRFTRNASQATATGATSVPAGSIGGTVWTQISPTLARVTFTLAGPVPALTKLSISLPSGYGVVMPEDGVRADDATFTVAINHQGNG